MQWTKKKQTNKLLKINTLLITHTNKSNSQNSISQATMRDRHTKQNSPFLDHSFSLFSLLIFQEKWQRTEKKNMENLRWNPFCKLNTYANKQALWNETHTHAHITHIISSTMSIYDFGCTLFLQKKKTHKKFIKWERILLALELWTFFVQ